MKRTSDQIEDILNTALDLQADAGRRDYVDQACGEDAELRIHINELIGNHLAAGSFLETPILNLIERVTEQPGAVIGQYKLQDQIGEGGFGVIFRAQQQTPIHRTVALKILKPGMDSSQVVARFENERQALALMDHPNIARVLDGGQTSSGRPYFVMELVNGIAITEYAELKHLPISKRLILFTDVCRAIQHAHEKGLIHRDIKPGNVLVTDQDSESVVKVIDFGIAKLLGQPSTENMFQTVNGQLVGTPMYMSPEQTQFGSHDIDTRADIYSLGVLLYELLTGQTPFDLERFRTASINEICRIIRDEEPTRPSLRHKTYRMSYRKIGDSGKQETGCQIFREELDWVVFRCLEKDRNRRYQSAIGLAEDVERYLNGEPLVVGPPHCGIALGIF